MDVKYPQTFESFKKSVLENCFSIEQSSVSSFSQLLNLQINKNNPTDDLVGKYDVNRAHEKRFSLLPKVIVSIQ